MATVVEANLSRIRGDTTPFTVTITTDGVTTIDVTGYYFVMTADPSNAPTNSDNNLFQLTSPSGGITLSDPTNGVITVTLTTGAADQTPGSYYYDLQMTDGSANITTILKGTYEVIQDITK